MQKVLRKLIGSKTNNDIVPPVNLGEITKFESSNNLFLPVELKELYQKFDGGEVLIPGPTIFGIEPSKKRPDLKTANSYEKRMNFSIPNNYLIIAKLNFGDYICINLNTPNDVIQWDHENDKIFCSWNNLEEWLQENVDSFEEFEDKMS